ncbi:MAG TPA: DUF4214 domain-containing protein [Xenococcaceae cyanobacterium]|jgi:hypothetical protein
MFKEITSDQINAEEIKNRILAYASLQAADTVVDYDYWYGNITTYTLSLRLSGVYGEKQFKDVLTSGADTTINLGKYAYLENEVFLQETAHLDALNFVKQLYQAFLRREADPGGLAGNVEQLKNGALRENLVVGLRNSQEADGVFLRVTACLDDATFVEIAHRVYLNPKYSQHRKSGDIAALKQGKSREAVFQAFKQFQQTQITLQNLEQDFYQEDTDLIGKTEHLDNSSFVQELYRTFLKREADPGGLESQVAQLEQGVSRREVLYALRTSAEAANVFVNLTAGLDNETFIEVAYAAYLKQELDSRYKPAYVEALNQGNPRQTILS